ncbi:DNA-binding protein RFX7-like [Brienomyrus brachyistius]|uniref:DNA-binding protein RFX7-like n=1 Tax=Brienomyrus brachyistius TaxID=42636 RepID=UPI0020B2C27C|nr:DNA-binding protein RFX7-like [Brienomyrus brachyistius]
MAENQQKNPQPGTSCLPSPLHGLHGVEAGVLRHRIKASICKSAQSKVDNILQDVEKFTDIEKLYLYLKLPSGPSNGSDKCEQPSLSSSRTQQTHAFTWIQNHLEEHPDTSLPKQEVYDEYKSYCDNLGYHPLSAADFGKIMKNVFPNMKARRLGMRGKSKYCYSGLRKKALVHVPCLPNLDVHKTSNGCEVLESSGVPSSAEDEVRLAACGLVCEWAQKVLSQSFDCVEDLARYLLNSQFISSKSMAALTLTTGTSTGGMKMSAESCPFVPVDDSRYFQPQAKTLPSPTVDAKQQLQRKIQKKQQEQKLHSPLPGDGQTLTPTQARRAEAGTPCVGPSISCGSPALLSPQPTIGIVVTVPSPVTGPRTKQLTSPSPMGAAENKVVPMNFQVVSQPIQPVKQTAKASLSVSASPVCERVPGRSRYPQILPKPSATGALTLRSPQTLLITNSPIKTVVPTSHVAPVNVVKMTTISLPAGSGTGSTTLRPVLTGVSSTGLLEEQQQLLQTQNSSQQSPLLSPVVTKSGCMATAAAANVKMEREAIPDNNRDPVAEQLNTTQEAAAVPKGVRGAKPRAASEPTPYSTGALGPDGAGKTKCGEKFPFSANTASAGSNTNSNKRENASCLTIPSQSTTITLSSYPNTTATSPRESPLGSGSLRKRPGAVLESVPVKKVFITQHPASGAESPTDASKAVPQSGTPTRPESAPATTTCKVTVKLNSTVPTRILARCDSPLGNPSIFQTVAKLQASPQPKGEGLPSKSEDSGLTSRAIASTSSQALLKEIASSSLAMQTSLALTDTSIMDELKNPIWEEGQLGSLQQHAFVHQMLDHRSVTTPVMDQLPMEPQAPPSDELTLHSDVEFTGSQPSVDYFPFNDDDMTQDSIVEELVQMEEQMKLNSLRSYGSCVDVSLQSQSAAVPGSVLSNHQTDIAFYHSLHSSTTPTLTPTPTPTSEIMAAGSGLTRESPCSRLAPATPVDGALGSNRHTPVGTPHSNCSTSVPPSPVDSCRNPFAFTPINSSITGYHNASIVSSSPLKPMQRPTATHPDKVKLEWINNGYNSDGGTSAISNNGISILPNYQNLVEDQFRKPHAFAIPGHSHQSQTRHDTNFGRLTPVSPVQQQATVLTNQGTVEGFAVPAPLDNKVIVSSAGGTFRCRSVSPAVRQRNLSGSTVHTSISGSMLSQFNPPVTPEVLNIFANSCPNMGSSSMAQRSQSVPLNVMMQTEMLPVQTTNNSTKITSVLLSKMDPDGDDAVRGLGVNNMPSNYTARMNLTQILETTSTFQGGVSHHSLLNTNANHNPSQFQKPSYLMKNARNEQMSLYSRDSQAQVSPEEQQPELQQGQPLQNEQSQLEATSESQQPLDFDSTVKDLLGDDALNPGSQLTGQMVSELTSVASDFSSDIRLTSELSSSINDLDTNLLFDPSQQQGQYEDSTLEELKNDPLFQQICTENSVNFDWLESKDQHTVEMLG